MCQVPTIPTARRLLREMDSEQQVGTLYANNTPRALLVLYGIANPTKNRIGQLVIAPCLLRPPQLNPIPSALHDLTARSLPSLPSLLSLHSLHSLLLTVSVASPSYLK